MDPEFSQAFFHRGCIRYDAHDFTEAHFDFQRALDFQPDDNDSQLRIWLARSRLGEKDAATKNLRKYLTDYDGTTNATVPRGQDPTELTLPEAIALLRARADMAPKKAKKAAKKTTKKTVKKAAKKTAKKAVKKAAKKATAPAAKKAVAATVDQPSA